MRCRVAVGVILRRLLDNRKRRSILVVAVVVAAAVAHLPRRREASHLHHDGLFFRPRVLRDLAQVLAVAPLQVAMVRAFLAVKKLPRGYPTGAWRR